ncbi:MAG: glycosyltransferase, partial [Candidatus Omnitrophota bacterium]
WIHPSIDAYTVACHAAKETLVAEGVSGGKINVLGIPISMQFLKKYDKKDIAAERGFRLDMPSILVMGGGLGFGPIKDIVRELDNLESPSQLIVVCGGNKHLYDWFSARKNSFRKPIFIYGYIDFINKLMDFSDIIITKAGGITVSEALSKRMAIIIINPIPGQEERNVNYLKSRNALINADSIKNISSIVEELLHDQDKLLSIKTAAELNSLINSSLNLADFILNFDAQETK